MQEDVAHGDCVDAPRRRGSRRRTRLARRDFPEARLAGLVDVVDLLQGDPFGGLRGEVRDGCDVRFLGFVDGHFEGAFVLVGDDLGGEVPSLGVGSGKSASA